MARFYAHSLEGRPTSEWQLLDQHLKNVAERARSFANKFRAGDWGYLAGLWHDLGKCSQEFQTKLLEQNRRRVDHSTAGGRHAVTKWPDAGKLLAYTIVGHHSGLPNGKSSSRGNLTSRLDSNRVVPQISAECSDLLDFEGMLSIPIEFAKGRIGFQLSFFIRMLYSCLVDADFLDTEGFIDPDKASVRNNRPVLADLESPLFARLHLFKADSDINKKREVILRACVDAASGPPGLFTLTVPTGGGKTLSSLAFAMKHGLIHEKDRIIYVIPFTSIIEQNAAVFRSVLGDEAVLEHHSNFVAEETEADEKDDSTQAKRHRMACENWDAPVVVTTNVQFFDSLFAHRSSRCRKLHNMVNSVIIMDEAQMLPEPYLRPCMEAIRELTKNYGCTVVLCTATQPALIRSDSFPYGFSASDVTEIVTDPHQLHVAFKRFHFKNIGRISNDELVGKISEKDRILCIVNTRQRAYDLFQMIRDFPGAYHLSARMCPAHRSQMLSRIRKSLETTGPCRVVATQLVEAGVDVDFPVVFREMAGLDAIAQAAGRCNRNAKLASGEVCVFVPEDGRIPRIFRRAVSGADSVLRRFKDPFQPEGITDYFKQVYWLAGEELDKKHVLGDLECGVVAGDFPFREVAEKFQLIDSEMTPIVVPWDSKAEKLINRLKYAEFPRSILRQLQSYTVQIYPHEFVRLQEAGAIDMIQDRYAALASLVPFYEADCGLNVSRDLSPEEFII